ncbi:universal stress protein [Luteimonas sp. RD2P54]|uniref:Universal stress protein n=1 Tax=Luteimonas endophytica TaxID=3042023 RepID=A0ABT6J4N1_9GAMM|nr:universal stress protein [Luteimonas endophytica]MDH5821769.1 universal stress protein [Luteimonas endophytica]
MYRDIFLPVTGSPGDRDAIAFAIDFARDFEAHLTLLETVHLPTPPVGPFGASPDLAIGQLFGRLREQGAANAARYRTQLEQAGVRHEVRLVESLFFGPERTAAHAAHPSDLVVLAGPHGDTAEGVPAHRYFGELLLESGRPVLMVPPSCATRMPARRVLLAWRPRREAARALHDALPLLAQAERVDVVVVDPKQGRDDGHQSGADVARHLARHDIDASVVELSSGGRTVSSVLIEHARQMPAQLIVAGGYGHSRTREWVMGGVTRELLISAPVPVLFSH